MSEKKPPSSSSSIEPDLVRELAAILRDTGLTEIEVERGDLRLRISRAATAAGPVAYAQAPAPAAAIAVAPAEPPPPAARDYKGHPGAVSSPMVGTAFLAPKPGEAAYVKVGDLVEEGATLLIIEAMKTFNPIPAHKAGRVAEILVSDQQPIEFGQLLVVIE